MILDYQSNTMFTVEMIERSLARLNATSSDNLFRAEVTLDVALPALDIRRAEIEVKRDYMGLVPDLKPAAEKLVGVRVGPGMTKIVRAILGGPEGSERIATLVLDAMEMLINSLTVQQLRKATDSGGVDLPADQETDKVRLNRRVIGEDAMRILAENPRLKNSCAAFSDL